MTFAGDITTSGAQAQGVFIQSIGGASGSGGKGDSWFDSDSGLASVPGPGGEATISYANGTITTKGDEASAILVESVGGFAGSSGGASGFVGYGANGASGGDGNTVTTTLNAVSVATTGNSSIGLSALSVGGGGGVGSKDDGFVTIGAAGGAGGAGGNVTVTLTDTNTITTKGDDASGIFVLSAGGGGGTSGGNEGVVALGGAGGKGGNGDVATFSADGNTTITTEGEYAVGVMISSIGNGGGKSTSPTGPWALGANGGDGGSGSDVTFDLKSGTLGVTTQGSIADGVLISSVGGGGGHGGSSLAALDIIKPVLGSQGGDGGSGGDITVTSEGGSVDIETSGFKSNGFVAQSIGGGGGTGGNVVNVDIGLTFNQQTAALATTAAHHGGTVNVGNKDTVGLTGSVTTHGATSSALLVQSVGGGGGSAGNSIEAGSTLEFNHDMGAGGQDGGTGGDVTVNSKTDATTDGDHADGILVQSIGGGGGQSSNVIDANVGGEISQFIGNQGSSAGTAGSAGAVWVQTDSTVETKGDNALGVVAQSIGGGGGKAGYTVDGDVSINAGISLGSSGGAGGSSGTVELTTAGSVTTSGNLSTGVMAQSVAGGGGTAGTTVNGNAGISLSYTHGGNGGLGGMASDITLINNASVTTAGSGATGVLAQSMGGGGGSGGVTASASFGIVGDLNIAHGGDGGNGGTAGKVTLTNTENIKTSGDSSHGVFAQSLGGSGGVGGFLGTGAGSAGPISASVNVSVGGSGGKGSTADTVDITNSGQITTAGYHSTGITAQSVGGNGGDGGAIIAGAIDLSSDGSGSVNVSVGGDGGDSGTAKAVTVTNNSGGDITTSGHLSYGIFAQSIGGNGGKGGGSYAFTLSGSTGPTVDASVSIGGNGGSGSVGSSVTVENDATLKTSGGNSHGIYAQSVGGNGGVGAYGFAFAGDFFYKPGDNNLDVNANVALGGSGGSGEDAGSVTVQNNGDISTQTETAYGIYAQSVGGGGGDGGQAGSHTFGYTKKQTKTDEGKSYSLNFTMGGDQGVSGDGNDVSVTHSAGTISTVGNASYAIYAQSVGGGGGNSGNGSPGLKGWVADIKNTGEFLDDLYDTYKDVKGFPKDELSFEIDIGGQAGASGTGGNVTVENDATLTTTGDSGTAIFAQSVGGGGGSGGDGSQGLLTSITVARSGSGGGNGGNVAVTNSGNISTGGSGAMGIYAQSVGGGGGSAGDIESSIVTAVANFYETMGAQIFGKDNGGQGGDGGDVNITSTGQINTANENAHGIWVQSVGGSGGAGGNLGSKTDSVSIGSAGDAGNSGYVDIAIDGLINVKGTGSHGIFAQSASGTDGYSGGVKMRIAGTVKTEGANARAILAQSSEIGTDDPQGSESSGSTQCKDAECRGTSHIYVNKGGLVETTNSSAYETIAISGGRSNYNSDGSLSYSNMIQNEGTIQSANADSVVIANDSQGALRIHNWNGGILSGSLQLDDSNRTEFENLQAAYFHAGKTVYLGKLGNYTGYDGSTMSPYGQNIVGTSTVSLGETYAEAGTLWIDVQQNSTGTVLNDQIVFDGLAQGAQINLTGVIQPVWVGSTTLSSGNTGVLHIVSLTNDANLKTMTATLVNTPTVTYTLSNKTSDIFVNYTIDYTGSAAGIELGNNALSYARYLSSAMAAIEATASGNTEEASMHATTILNTTSADKLAAIEATASGDTEEALSMHATTILNTTSADELAAIYGSHTPEESLIGATRAVSASHRLNQLMQSCPTLDPTTGTDFLRQNDCAWVQAIGSHLNQNATGESPEFSETTWGIALGSQREIAADTFIEIVGQFETLSIDGDNFSQDGERYSLGLALKKEIGRFTLSTALTGGIYSLNYDRAYKSSQIWQQANSDIDGGFLGAEVRASAVFLGQSGYYAKPSAALAYTQVWQDSFTESGNGLLNWDVGSVSDGWLAMTPMIELGRAFSGNDHSMLAFIRAGLTVVLNKPSMDASSTLVDADASLGELNFTMGTDRCQGDLTVGFDAQLQDNLSLSIRAQTALSTNSYDYGGSAKLEFRF
ncbi:autotransporter outer membrane beta-barrel domain-containing protein [Desulfotalea psychrophila]|uniref:autotransporter outer membrane beta-barrel domain-containing protein n=1 Tax=Desulfotalea psychrophila TaxID=84980 RepID=UPI00059C5E00|nr:autotransporter outer membrane beta-barrel domain-containing protein [Desulfotalea psychrophila]